MKLGLLGAAARVVQGRSAAHRRELGLPREMVYRHPFPRDRASACASSAKCRRVRPSAGLQADHIFIDELRRAGLYDKVSQAFAVFLPVKSVGVVGDARAL